MQEIEENLQRTRIFIVRENWFGCTGMSAFFAFLRLGLDIWSITEGEYVPIRWRSLPMKIAGRVLRPEAVAEFNRAVLVEARRFRPHLFLAFKAPFLRASTLRSLAAEGIVRYCFYPDVSLFSHGPHLPAAIREYDWIFTTKSFGGADLKRAFGIERASYLPHAFDPLVHRPIEATPEDAARYACDASFIGGWSYKKEMILNALIRRRPNLHLKIWGDRWQNLPPNSPLRQFAAFEPVFGSCYAAAISSSKINLGLLHEQVCGASSGDRITSRTFHIPACGGLLLHERTEDLLTIFKEDESCACFGDVDELVQKVDHLLNDPVERRRISANGLAAVRAGHSWDDRARSILDHFLERGRGQG
jgi:spore maturation protein CgeB